MQKIRSSDGCFCQGRGNSSNEIPRTWLLGQLKERAGFLVCKNLSLLSTLPWAAMSFAAPPKKNKKREWNQRRMKLLYDIFVRYLFDFIDELDRFRFESVLNCKVDARARDIWNEWEWGLSPGVGAIRLIKKNKLIDQKCSSDIYYLFCKKFVKKDPFTIHPKKVSRLPSDLHINYPNFPTTHGPHSTQFTGQWWCASPHAIASDVRHRYRFNDNKP